MIATKPTKARMAFTGEIVFERTDLPHSPKHPDVHLFESDHGKHIFVVNGSRLYDLDDASFYDLQSSIEYSSGHSKVNEILDSLVLIDAPYIADEPLVSPKFTSVSLAVAQVCNLGCTYCYAQEGSFGAPAKNMPLETAMATVDLLLKDAQRGERVSLAFLGGEPLINRSGVYKITEYAALEAERKGVAIGFSITTNATLLTVEDKAFFEKYGFGITVSLDGVGETHDRLRPYKNGSGSFSSILKRLEPFLEGGTRLTARVTVTPKNLCLPETLDGLVALGFSSVGFSPVLSSPTGRDELEAKDFETLLDQMIACGRKFEVEILAGRSYPFSNISTALLEIHRGTHRPYPCGAGAGYLGASADGDLFACHRFVDDDKARMGDLASGINNQKQNDWLRDRHVHKQDPCKSCWARYLCSGGCHHEVINRGRPACDFIRGWLHYCLTAYNNLLEHSPAYFAQK